MSVHTAYNLLPDEELVALYREGDRIAAEYLLARYKATVRLQASKLFLIGGETEDLIQEGMIGVYGAMSDYDENAGASFASFAKLCASRRMYKAIDASQDKKHSPLNGYISLYESIEGVTNTDADGKNASGSFSDRIVTASFGLVSPEESVLSDEGVREINIAIEESLSDFEREAVKLSIAGFTNTEIAELLAKKPKETDNAVQRAKGKLRKILRNKKADSVISESAVQVS